MPMFSKNFSKSLGISIALHLTILATVSSMSLFSSPLPNKIMQKVVFIKPVNLKDIKIPAPEAKKTPPKTIKKVEPKPQKNVVKKIKKKVEKKAETPKKEKPKPLPTPTPTPSESPEPSQDEIKISILRKQPYFKKWSDERLKRLELPPGMKDWSDTVKLTEYFDNQYNWVYTPPALGNDKKNTSDNNNEKIFEEIKDIVWKEDKENKEAKNYEINFYKDKIGFIASFNEKEPITVTYFPFDADKIRKEQKKDGNTEDVLPSDEIQVKIPEKLDVNEVKYFYLTYNEKYETEKRYLILDILGQYKIILEEESKK